MHEWPQIDLKHSSLKSTLYTIRQVLTPEAQILVHFALQPTVFEIQGCQELEMHRTTPDWHETFNYKKYPVYTKSYLPRIKIWSLSLYDQQLSRYNIVANQKNPKYTDWPWTPWTLNGHKYSVYTKNCPPKAKFCSVSLNDQLFST